MLPYVSKCNLLYNKNGATILEQLLLVGFYHSSSLELEICGTFFGLTFLVIANLTDVYDI